MARQRSCRLGDKVAGLQSWASNRDASPVACLGGAHNIGRFEGGCPLSGRGPLLFAPPMIRSIRFAIEVAGW
jgi:hypothetical protein